MPDLKPCPFCGGPAGVMKAAGVHQACCASSECPANGIYDTHDQAVAAWNDRAYPPLPDGAPDLAPVDRAVEAIKALPEDALGFGHTDEFRWPIRDELVGALLLMKAAIQIALAPTPAEEPITVRSVEEVLGDPMGYVDVPRPPRHLSEEHREALSSLANALATAADGMRALSDEELAKIAEACAAATEINCWAFTYQAAQILAAEVARENRRRGISR